MAVKFPDFLQNNNPNAVLIDATENQTKGFGFFDAITGGTINRNSLDSALQVTGYLAIVGSTAYIYNGGGWTDTSNWSEVGSGSGLDNVVEDESPELGGNLDVLARSIVSSSNRDITFTPNGTGHVNLDGVVEFKRFASGSEPEAFLGGMYADESNRLYFGVT
jgi:hypothetical protein